MKPIIVLLILMLSIGFASAELYNTTAEMLTATSVYNESARIDSVNSTATNSLPKAGGTMTGNITVGTNIGLVVNSSAYIIFNGTTWIIRAG